MGEILGVGCTHRPLMLRPNEDWTFMMRAALDDPAMPEAMKNPAAWPAPLCEDLGNDLGALAASRALEPMGRAQGQDDACARPPRGREISRLRADRIRHRCRIRLQALAPPDG